MHTANLLWALLFAVGCGAPNLPATPRPPAPSAIAFVHDDFSRALAQAKASNKPLFVDAWAPWCHSCQSLRAFVLTDPKLARVGADFVWLSVDVDLPQNQGWVERFGHEVLPTLWVIDPNTEKALLKWGGTVTAAELVDLLSTIAHQRSSNPEATALVAFSAGNQAQAAGDAPAAIALYEKALRHTDQSSALRARVTEALVSTYSLRGEPLPCAALAAREAPTLARGTSRATVLVTGLECARQAHRDAEAKLLLDECLHYAQDRGSELLIDDRSALYEAAFEALSHAGETARGAQIANEWMSFLDEAATRSNTPLERRSLDPLRLNAYFAVGNPRLAITMLQASEAEDPTDYNAPARLARVHLTLGELQDATRAAHRAATRVYGPRSLKVFTLAADIAKARGDVAGEREALTQALERTAHSPLTKSQQAMRAQLEKRLGSLPIHETK